MSAPADPAFSATEIAGRLGRTRAALAARGLDAGVFFAARQLGLWRGNATPLEAGMVLHVVANLYGEATLAAGHTVLVTAGGAEPLTRFAHAAADLGR